MRRCTHLEFPLSLSGDERRRKAKDSSPAQGRNQNFLCRRGKPRLVFFSPTSCTLRNCRLNRSWSLLLFFHLNLPDKLIMTFFVLIS